jgi:hypothetical protein
MKKFLLMAFLASSSLFSFEELDSRYCISFGSDLAENRVVEYFSFSCPHCLEIFKNEFKDVEKELIETGKLQWVFHPIPMDMTTLQGMICIDKLTQEEKQIFLEAILLECANSDISDDLIAILMKKAMEVLGSPIDNLDDMKALEEMEAFDAAFEFVKQEDTLDAVPAFSVNGVLVTDQLPTKSNVKKIISSGRSF